MLIVPLLVVIGNAVVRWLSGLPHSATSDIILVFVVFDVAMGVHAKEFGPFVKLPELKMHLVAISFVLLIVNLILWVVTAFLIERKLLDYYDKRRRKYTVSPLGLIFTSAFIAVFVFASNTIIFTYGA